MNAQIITQAINPFRSFLFLLDSWMNNESPSN